MGSREHRRVLARGSQSIADLFDGTIGASHGLPLTAVFVPALSAVRVPYDILDIGVEP